jgi:hypothetical protein
MQIYGDTSCVVQISTFASELLARIEEPPGLASLRALLIACGQLEQLVVEAGAMPNELCVSACRATDHAAAAFYTAWARENSHAPVVDWQLARETQLLRSHLGRLARAGTSTGILKIPEGFAFYALYPEQYCAAAAAYSKRCPRGPGVTHVIGVRSIGTSLSAAVAVVLKAANVPHCRYTVRPNGPPFERQIELPKHLSSHDSVLVVDEGPGLSGSTFYAAARALRARGVAASKQVYFCAHSEPPGKMASPEISEFWRQAERYVASRHDSALSSAGTLCETIRAKLQSEFESEVLLLDDVSHGRWRIAAFGEPVSWPAVNAIFERPKLLAQLADGRRVLLKYYGQVLRSDPVTREIDWADAAAARGIAKSGANALRIHGYVARLWIDGDLLTAADKSPAVLEQLATLLFDRPRQHRCEKGSAAEAFYGASGSLAPREWIRLPGGRICKLPETLAGYDHTAIDTEPLGWDLAQAVVEWQLTAAEAEQLLRLFRASSGIQIRPEDVAPHIRRYAAFQGGKALFCAEQADAAEARRLQAEATRYAAYEHGTA